MKRHLLLLVGVAALFFTSCETDIDVNAEYKDITVVYGLINPQDSVHYIKINKAFLGTGNALDMAADADNFTYAPNEITVTVEEYDGSNLIATHAVTRTTNDIPKDNGVFDNSTNVLYKFVDQPVNRYSKFKVVIYNGELDKEITAETQMVKDILITKPTSNSKFQFWIGTVSNGNPNAQTVRITSGPDQGRIEGVLIFNYIEHPLTITGNPSVAKTLEMPLGTITATTSAGGETMEWELDGEIFFETIESSIKPITTADSLSHRELDNISVIFNVAGTELHTFMQVSAPSTSVNQDKPEYTNVENGIGVFSSREIVLWESGIDPQTSNNINIQNSTISYLQNLNRGFCFGTTGIGFPVAPCVQL
jgi:hypothetical protein